MRGCYCIARVQEKMIVPPLKVTDEIPNGVPGILIKCLFLIQIKKTLGNSARVNPLTNGWSVSDRLCNRHADIIASTCLRISRNFRTKLALDEMTILMLFT